MWRILNESHVNALMLTALLNQELHTNCFVLSQNPFDNEILVLHSQAHESDYSWPYAPLIYIYLMLEQWPDSSLRMIPERPPIVPFPCSDYSALLLLTNPSKEKDRLTFLSMFGLLLCICLSKVLLSSLSFLYFFHLNNNSWLNENYQAYRQSFVFTSVPVSMKC